MDISRKLAAAILGAVLAGCASTERVAQSVVDANMAQETAANQLVLLNIVRAAHRHPMHFTRITQLRMPVGVGNTTFSLPIPFGPDRTQAYQLGNSFAQSYSADTEVQNTQEFMQGVSASVPPSLLAYYLDQGWPQDLIFHVFVKIVEIYEREGDKDPVLVGYLDNYPGNKDQLADFQRFTDALEPCRLEFGEKPTPRMIGPRLTTKEAFGDLKTVAELQKADIGFTPVDKNDRPAKSSDEYRLSRPPGKEIQFGVTPKLGKTCAGVPVRVVRPGESLSAAGTTTLKISGGVVSGDKPSDRAHALILPRPPEGSDTKTYQANLILRSPEAMLYYLGEIVRIQPRDVLLGTDGWKTAGPSAANRRLFGLHRDDGTKGLSSVNYLGTSYVLPLGSEVDRSTQTLWLVSQILALQNKGTTSPVTSNVRLVN